ncbi:hypothetical protein G6F48_008659 [Rhizopus delemar]|nr:hypothetical protein G6F48_008659 [Rhizopus delemar]
MNKYSSSVLDSDCSDELLKPPPPSPKEMTMDNHTPIHAHTLNKLLRKTLNQQIIKTEKMKKQQTLKGAIMKVTASDKLRTFVLDEDTIIRELRKMGL